MCYLLNMENQEVLQPPRPRIDVKEALDEKNRKVRRLGQIVEYPGNTLEGIPSRYRTVSVGAVEKLMLLRDEVPEAPLMSMTQTDSTENSEEVREIELTILALDEKGNLVKVPYDKEGKRKDPEIVGSWKQKKHTSEKLGIPRLVELPSDIDNEAAAVNLIKGFESDSYLLPTLTAKKKRIKINEYEPEAKSEELNAA